MRFNSCHLNLLGCGLAVLLAARPAAAETTNLTLVADTTLHLFFPDNNFGGGDAFRAGGRNLANGGGQARALLRFDIAGHLPAGATINSVQLTLTAVVNVNGPGSTFDLHRLLAAWGEGNGDPSLGTSAAPGEATWNHRQSPATAWATAGGDYEAAASGSQALEGLGSYNFAAAGMVADVQAWLDQPETNFGWLLRSQAETTPGTIRRFASRAAALGFPQLAIDYTLETVPPAEPPELFDVARVGNEIRFSFQAQADRPYAVEFRDTLGVTNWTVLTNIPALPADATLHVTNEIAGSERYFRARTP